MKKYQILALGLSALVIAACNSGNRRVSGNQCPLNYKVEMNPIRGETAISMDPTAKQLVPGTYEYAGATVYFHDKKEDFRVEITDGKDPRNSALYKATPTCIRNSKPNLMLNFETQGISKLEVDATFKTFYDLKSYGAIVIPGSLKPSSIVKQQKVDAAPGKAYENVATPIMIKRNEVDYEIRSAFEDQNKKVFLTVRFKLKKLQPPAPAKPAKS